MHPQPDASHSSRGSSSLEQLIVLQILRDDHHERWSRAELARETGAPPQDVGEALVGLEKDGVVHLSGDSAWASRAIRRLDELELIAI